MAVAILVFTFFFFFFFWALRRATNRKSNGKLPPGPPPFPVIGNLHQLGNPAQRTLHELSKKYGAIMFLKLGSVPTLIVSSSEAAKLFLKTHDLIFANRPTVAAGKYMFYNHKDIALAQHGYYWRSMRKICVLELLTAKRIESFKSVREEELSLGIRCIWEKSGQGRVGVDVSEVIASFTSDVSWRMITGRKYSDQDLGGRGFKWVIGEMSVLAGAFNIGDFIPLLDWLDLQGLKRRMKKAHSLFDRLAEKVIEEHIERRQRFADVHKEEHKKDLVDVLLDMDVAKLQTDMEFTRQDMKAIILDLFAAGMETTATTLEWTMSELFKNPNVMKKLQEEIECVVGKDRIVYESDLGSMEYLHCVVKEALRLYPVVPLLMPHESTQDCIVEASNQSYFIPAKTRVMVNAWAIGRDPSMWEDCLSFKPERFMVRSFDVIRDPEMSMIPFGSGRRGCPGASMAIAALQIFIAQLVHCFDWRIEGDPSMLDMNEVFGATIPRKVHLVALPTWGLVVPSSLSMG